MAQANLKPTKTPVVDKPTIHLELARDAISETVNCLLEVAAHKERGTLHSTIAKGFSLHAMLEVSCMSNEQREKLLVRVELECKASAFKLLKRYAKAGNDGTIRLDSIKWPEIKVAGVTREAKDWQERLAVLPMILDDKKQPLDSYRKFFDHILPTKDDKSLKRIAKALADHDNLSKTEKEAVERIKSDLQTKRGVETLKDIDVANNTANYTIIGNINDVSQITDDK